jgi:hypothetical protein
MEASDKLASLPDNFDIIAYLNSQLRKGYGHEDIHIWDNLFNSKYYMDWYNSADRYIQENTTINIKCVVPKHLGGSAPIFYTIPNNTTPI